MDRLNSAMVRASFVWLLTGVILGGLMMVDRAVPGDWRRWAQPTHAHMLFVGWFIQFAVGIAYWLLPRKRSPDRPLGYDERVAYAAVIALNLGLLLRVVGEPAERSGAASPVTLAILAGSAILQVAAIAVFVTQLWPRVGPRLPRSQPATGRAPQRKHTDDTVSPDEP